MAQLQRLRKRLDGLRPAQRRDPGEIGRRRVRRRRVGRNEPVLAGASRSGRPRPGRAQVEQALPIPGHEGVEVDQLLHALGHAVGHAGRDHAAVAVPQQRNVAQALELDDAQHVPDVRLQVHGRARVMRPLAEAGVGRREHLVAGGAQQRSHLLPRPARRPRPMTDEKRRHRPRSPAAPKSFEPSTTGVIRAPLLDAPLGPVAQ